MIFAKLYRIETQLVFAVTAGPRGAVGSMSDSKYRDPGFDTQSRHILLFSLL